MTKPMLLADFTRLPPASRACPLDGLSAAIDMVAEAAPASHRFLRYQYYAAALALHGGAARTMLVEHDGDAVIALPFVRTGPTAARLARLPGVEAPFRGFPVAADTPGAAFDTLVDALAGELNALRIGPVADADAMFAALRASAARRGWVVLDRPAAGSLSARSVTLTTSETLLDGPALVAGGFASLTAIEDGAALAFWRAAAADSVLAAMLSARVVTRDDGATAFALHLGTSGAHDVVATGGDADLLEACSRPAMRDWLLVRPGLPALLGRALSGLWLRAPVDPAMPSPL